MVGDRGVIAVSWLLGWEAAARFLAARRRTDDGELPDDFRCECHWYPHEADCPAGPCWWCGHPPEEHFDGEDWERRGAELEASYRRGP